MVATPEHACRTAPTRRRQFPARASWLPALAVGLAALAARVWVVVRGDGLHGLVGYDPGVYYAAADAFVHGRVPYRDFLLLHPPGIVLVLSPFAALGSVTSDATGMAVARAAIILLGTLNAVLMTRVAQRFSVVAAVAGGLSYALWAPVVVVDNQTRLEPVGNVALLLALLLLWRRASVSARDDVLAGAALGLGVAVKIWGVLPLVVVCGWQLVERGRPAAARVAAGAVAAGSMACLPFLLAAPHDVPRMVVGDQLGRPRMRFAPLERVYGMAVAGGTGASHRLLTVAATGVVALVVVAVAVAWRERSARVLVVLLGTQTLLLLAAPSYFSFYAAFLAPAGALTVGVAAGVVAQRLAGRGRRARLAGAGALGAVTVSAVVLLVPTRVAGSRPFPGRQLGAAAAGQRCVVSDTPLALIEMDVLSKALRNGCPVWVDVTGYTYEARLSYGPDGTVLPRRRNPAWQRRVLGYLTSGDAVLVARPETGLSRASQRAIARWPVLARVGGYSLHGRPNR